MNNLQESYDLLFEAHQNALKELTVVNERNDMILEDMKILLKELSSQSIYVRSWYSLETRKVVDRYKPMMP